MATDWQTLEEAEDHAYFMAELVDISPESFTLEEKRKILDDMLEASSAIENRMRGNFAELDEVTQTRLLDSLGTSGYRDRDWWYRMLMDGPQTSRQADHLDASAPASSKMRGRPCVDLSEATKRYESSLSISQSRGRKGSMPRHSSTASAVATLQTTSSRVTTGSRSRVPARRRRGSPGGACSAPLP